ncbi:RNA-guided endonuclease InsQ/TnpB family protein [Streptomyces sp. NPDC052043]|uniref:RNA-guided endonuclease InsQ/TnpB family protein n=1 Tax=Streptomyces sp. NPDC052043 TaxID=3365684 RepID=UPI0037D7F69B
MLSGRRYLLDLSSEQEEMCEEFGGICRSVWNTALEQRREYRRRGAWMNYVPHCAELADAKREHPWLKAAPSHALQQTLKDLDRACRDHGTFTVRWRSKARWSPSFRFPDAQQISVERLGRKWGRVKLPKLGRVRFRWSRPLGGEIRSATVSRKGGRWFVSFLVDDRAAAPERHAMPGTAVGIDRGVKTAVVTSDGDFHDRPFITAGESVRYRRLQQRLTRSKRGSANRHKTIRAIGRIMSRVSDRRGDFCAQRAARIVAKNALVVLEDLRISGIAGPGMVWIFNDAASQFPRPCQVSGLDLRRRVSDPAAGTLSDCGGWAASHTWLCQGQLSWKRPADAVTCALRGGVGGRVAAGHLHVGGRRTRS